MCKYLVEEHFQQNEEQVAKNLRQACVHVAMGHQEAYVVCMAQARGTVTGDEVRGLLGDGPCGASGKRSHIEF